MPATLYSSLRADTIEHTAVFALELIDPVTLQAVSPNGITVAAVFQRSGLWNKPLSRGSRFVWVLVSDPDGPPVAAAVPTSITVMPAAGSGYAPFTYAAADIAAGTSKDKSESALCRLYLRTTSTYRFPSGVTQVSGLLLAVPAVAGQPAQVLSGAQVWLQWLDASTNPSTPRAGGRCLSGASGDFTASLLFPSKASKSYPTAAADGSLTLTLFVARLDPLAGWQQRIPDPQQPNPLAGVRAGQVATLPAPIVWSNLKAG